MDDEHKVDAAAKPSRKKTFLTIGIVGAVMLFEGAAVFLATRWVSGSPEAALGADGASTGEFSSDPTDVELLIADLMAPNDKTGRVLLYEIEVAARVSGADREKLERLLQEQRMTLEDRLNNIIRAADPRILNEDGLETLKRQMRFEINKLFEDEDLIRVILIPKILPHRAGY